MIKKGDPMLSPPDSGHSDVLYGSYGLDQCLDLVERAMQAEGPKIELSEDWLTGEGIALTMIDTVPPDGHIADARISLREDGGFETGRRHRGIRQWHLYRASADCRDRAGNDGGPDPPAAIRYAHGGHDTGAYGSTGTFVAGRATQAAAEASG